MTRRSLFSFCFCLSVIACGGAAGDSPPARTAAPPREEPAPMEPRTVEEAQKQIARAADDLSHSALKYTDSDAKPPAEPSPTAGTSSKTEDSYSTCATPCRALASMKRAVEALCRMTGETDTKCVDARKTLADNVGKTSSCKCDN